MSASPFPSKGDDNAADQVVELTAGGTTSSLYVAPPRCPSSPLPDALFPNAHFPNVPVTKAPFPDAPLPDLPHTSRTSHSVSPAHSSTSHDSRRGQQPAPYPSAVWYSVPHSSGHSTLLSVWRVHLTPIAAFLRRFFADKYC